MSAIPWHLHDNAAHFHFRDLRAVIDLAAPSRGWTALRVASRDLAGAKLLALASVRTEPPGEMALIDHHIRGADLLATYQCASPPIQLDILWRAVDTVGGDAPPVILESIVSVRTEQLQSEPELAVESLLPFGEMLRLVAASGRFLTLDLRGGPMTFRPDNGMSCVLGRLPGDELSYAEMVHPADFSEDRLERLAFPAHGLVKLSHRLFPTRLEKGVILRARVRGLLLPRKDDDRRAAAAMAAFAAAEPPLGT